MTDHAVDGARPVFRLIYRSQTLVPSAQRRAQLGEIFATARRNNRRLGITGALMISDDSFVQVLEGDEHAVRELFAVIGDDGRHQHVTVLEEGSVADRGFGRWAMAKVAADGGADIRLMSNASKGVLVAAPADPSITPEQETILASMRASLVLDRA
jgi:hypothetical protein